MRAPLPVPSDPAAIDRLADDLDRHGYCIVRDVLGAEAVRRITGRIASRKAGVGAPERGDDEPVDWDRLAGDEWVLLTAGQDGLDDLVLHPVALALARHLLGERFHLSGFSAHVAHPGNEPMGLHTDQWWMPQPVMPGEPSLRPGDITRERQPHGNPEPVSRAIAPAVVLNVMWAVTDFTAETGATRLVPGSHLSGVHPDSKTWPTVDAEVPAGGAVIWDARTWHASGINRSGTPRIGVTTTYCAVQFRQMHNFPFALRPESQAVLSNELRDLLGFRLFSSYGATDDYTAVHARPGYERQG